MRSSLLILILSSLACSSFSQGRFQGKVREDKTYIPISGVNVESLASHKVTVTDSTGAFTMDVKVGDLLSFSIMGYAPDTVYITNTRYLNVYLQPQQNMLREVKVKEIEFPPGAFVFKPLLGPMGSKTVRYQTDKNGNPIGGVQLSPSAIFGNGKSSKAKIEQYQKEEQIALVFNADTLGRYMPIGGQELKNFVILYMPDVKTFFDKNFKLINYLNSCYREFMKIPVDKRQSANFLSLK